MSKWGTEIKLPVKIGEVKRGMGLKIKDSGPVQRLYGMQQDLELGFGGGGREKPEGPLEEVWLYKFVHGKEWIAEDVLVDLVGGDLAGVWKAAEEE